MTEHEMLAWYHRPNGHMFEQTLGDSEEQGSPVCCSPWGHKELDMPEWLNNNISPQRCWHIHGKRRLILTPSRTEEGMLSSEEPHGWLQKEEG